MKTRGMVLVALPLISFASAAGQASAAGTLAEWGRAMDLDPRITRELLRFRKGGSTLDDALAGSFIRDIGSRVSSSAERQIALLQNGGCTPFVEVSMGELDSLRIPPGVKPYRLVFFKESLRTFVRVPGGMALHYINSVRAGRLGRLERWAGPGQIRGSQEGNVEELRKRLRSRPPARAAQFPASIPMGRRGVH